MPVLEIVAVVGVVAGVVSAFTSSLTLFKTWREKRKAAKGDEVQRSLKTAPSCINETHTSLSKALGTRFVQGDEQSRAAHMRTLVNFNKTLVSMLKMAIQSGTSVDLGKLFHISETSRKDTVRTMTDLFQRIQTSNPVSRFVGRHGRSNNNEGISGAEHNRDAEPIRGPSLTNPELETDQHFWTTINSIQTTLSPPAEQQAWVIPAVTSGISVANLRKDLQSQEAERRIYGSGMETSESLLNAQLSDLSLANNASSVASFPASIHSSSHAPSSSSRSAQILEDNLRDLNSFDTRSTTESSSFIRMSSIPAGVGVAGSAQADPSARIRQWAEAASGQAVSPIEPILSHQSVAEPSIPNSPELVSRDNLSLIPPSPRIRRHGCEDNRASGHNSAHFRIFQETLSEQDDNVPKLPNFFHRGSSVTTPSQSQAQNISLTPAPVHTDRILRSSSEADMTAFCPGAIALEQASSQYPPTNILTRSGSLELTCLSCNSRILAQDLHVMAKESLNGQSKWIIANRFLARSHIARSPKSMATFGCLLCPRDGGAREVFQRRNDLWLHLQQSHTAIDFERDQDIMRG